jgi:ribonuclease D
LAAENRNLVVHAGREEYRFLRRATDVIPEHWFDIQIAAGMVGLDYPASYGKILQRVLGKKLHKGETRTDWRKRPLSESQVEYALQDVIHLIPLRDILYGQLEKMGRLGWYQGEIESWRQRTEDAESRGRWRRVNGTSGLSRRSMAVVKELWYWREEQARQRDCLSRRVLRDDLIVELARRARSGVSQIRAVRGFERRDLQKHLPEISACVARALAGPIDESGNSRRHDLPPQIAILAQFLNTALTSMCHRASISPGIVGTVQDVRDLIAQQLDLVEHDDETGPPVLTVGWRRELVGRQLVDLLAGRRALRITDPLSVQPLTFE